MKGININILVPYQLQPHCSVVWLLPRVILALRHPRRACNSSQWPSSSLVWGTIPGSSMWPQWNPICTENDQSSSSKSLLRLITSSFHALQVPPWPANDPQMTTIWLGQRHGIMPDCSSIFTNSKAKLIVVIAPSAFFILELVIPPLGTAIGDPFWPSWQLCHQICLVARKWVFFGRPSS